MGKEDMFSDSLRSKFASLIDNEDKKSDLKKEISRGTKERAEEHMRPEGFIQPEGSQSAEPSEQAGSSRQPERSEGAEQQIHPERGMPVSAAAPEKGIPASHSAADALEKEILPIVRDLNAQITVIRKEPAKSRPSGASSRTPRRAAAVSHITARVGERQERLKSQYRAERTITYTIRWNAERSGSAPDFGAARAVLEISCAAPKTPELRLVCREDGFIPLSEEDPGLMILHTIRPFEKGFPQGRYTLPLTEEMLQGIDPDTPLRLFLAEEDLGEYFMRPKREEPSEKSSARSFISGFRSLLPEPIICPNCLETLKRRNVIRACPICNTPAPNARGVVRCVREGCNGSTTKQICELCGEDLPDGFLEYEKYLRFSLIGTVGAGKTSFLTAMLHELKYTRNIPWVISHMNAATEASFREKDNLMFRDKVTLENTPRGWISPLLWQIRNRDKATDRKVPTYSMTIFDGAGEDYESIDRRNEIDARVSRYISGSKALVILIDPLALPGAAKMVSPEQRSWSATSDHEDDGQVSTDLVNSLADYIRNCCGIRRGDRIDRDVAVVFTKIDLFADEFRCGVTMQPGPHLMKRGFDVADADAVDEEVRSWLYEIGEHAFLNAVELNFRKDRLRFFGVSSFGRPPVGQYRLDEDVTPHRVLDPLVWMLYKEGIAPEV
ncbi:MAG: hypothetical protein LUI87_13245 [Lachnospiraceae bacterium]|nr:hypothetical protein [Lachnospiraceae bacterium]